MKFSNEAVAACIAAGIMSGGRGPRPKGANEWMEAWEKKNNVQYVAVVIDDKNYPADYKPSDAAKKACNVPSQRGRIAVSLLNACFAYDTKNNTLNSTVGVATVAPLFPEGYKPSKTTCQAIGKGKGRWSVEMLNKAWLYLQDNPEIDAVVEDKADSDKKNDDLPPYVKPDLFLDAKIGTPLFEKWQNAANEAQTIKALKAIGKVYQETGKLPANVTLFDLMVDDEEGFYDYSKGDGEYTRTKPFAHVR